MTTPAQPKPVDSTTDSNSLPGNSTSSRSTESSPVENRNNKVKTRGLSIRQKTYIGFGGLLLLMVAGMSITLYKLADIESTADDAIAQRQPAAALFQRLVQDLNLATALLNGYLLTGREDLKEEYEIIEADLFDNFSKTTNLSLFKQNEISSDDIDRAGRQLHQFKNYAQQLFELRDDGDKNFPGLALTQQTIQPHATAFLSALNLLLSSDDLALSNPKMLEARDTLNELRYIWVQMMNNLRLFLNSRNEEFLENFENFSNHAAVLLIKLDFMEQEFGFGELEDMADARILFLENLSPVISIYRGDRWRADAYLMKTEVQPLAEKLRSLFENIADYQLHAATLGGKTLTDALQQIRISTIVIIFIGLLLGSLLASRIINTILPPIRRLMQAAGQIAQGDLNAEVMVTTQDEIGQLGQTFNKMINDLRAAALNEQQHLDEMQTLNRELESRVQDRTKDLEQSEIRIRAILDNIGEGIIVLDDNGIIESINPAAENIFAMTENQAIGLNSALLIESTGSSNFAGQNHQDDEHTDAFQSTDSQQPTEYQGIRSDGSSFPMEFVVSDMDIGDNRLRVCILRDVSSRKETEATLANAQSQLVDAAHKSGMADMATGVLHNIGNILNSVNLAVEEVHRISSASKISGLLKANDLLLQHHENIGEFLTQDARGKKLPDYFIKMGKVLSGEIANINTESKGLIKKVTMMKEVISTQQSYAKSGFHSEQLNLSELIEDALKIQEASLKKWGVKLNAYYADTPPCMGQKSKLLQVITNLVKNAKEAMNNNDQYNRPKELTIETGTLNDKAIYLKIKDNGCGIGHEQLTKIFNHGFTTKESGHGFGLHTCANAMTEMKGTLKVDSEGLQKGACFTVTIPISKVA